MFQMGGGHAPAKAAAKSKPQAKAPARVKVTVQLEPRQREKLALLGGEAWLREQIDQARVPTVARE
jgi:hypothetical protein